MTTDERRAAIDAEVARVERRLRDLLEGVFKQAEETGDRDPRIDKWMVIGIYTWTDEDGDQMEHPVTTCESKSRHVQRGILHSALLTHNRNEFGVVSG